MPPEPLNDSDPELMTPRLSSAATFDSAMPIGPGGLFTLGEHGRIVINLPPPQGDDYQVDSFFDVWYEIETEQAGGTFDTEIVAMSLTGSSPPLDIGKHGIIVIDSLPGDLVTADPGDGPGGHLVTDDDKEIIVIDSLPGEIPAPDDSEPGEEGETLNPELINPDILNLNPDEEPDEELLIDPQLLNLGL